MHLLFIVREIDNEPQGILLISSVVKQAGHRTSLVVATEEDPLASARRLRPDVVAYTVYTGTQNAYLEINRQIKAELPVVSIFGGPHPTFFPEMIQRDGVDAICIGEGEYATLDLLNALEAGQSIAHLPNWHVRVGDQVYRNPLRPLLTADELDALPFPDRKLLYDAHPASARTRIRPIITGRGCPYNCSFCFNQAFAELYDTAKRTRQRSVGRVMEEVQTLRAQHGLDFVLFMDDTFIVNPKWLREFSAQYRAQVGLPFWCQVRADLVNDEKVRLLRDAGCVSVSFGIESGDDRLRNEILDRHMSREEILSAAQRLRDAGIAFSTNNMLGLPSGSLETDLETLRLNIQCRPAYANVFLYQPYPKTRLGEMALREGYMEGTFDDLSGSVSDSTVIRFSSEKEKRQIENLQKLFALNVEVPWLSGLVRRLVSLPRNRAFWFIYKLWKGYALNRRMFPMRMRPAEYVRAAWQYMRIRTQ
ncbi:MAG: B12-binding domain-containing radical SAM protein [Chloroflexi bacterium]|nr:B12-binding domain-containing radical SAM protein [Chloroflexota bacterium]